MTPPCFRPTVCDRVPSFPFTGSRGKVRPLHWYYEDTPTSAARLAGSLRSPSNTCAAPCPSLPPVQGRTPGEPGAFLFGATVPNRMETQETADLPGSWGTLRDSSPGSWTPVGPTCQAIRHAGAAPGGTTARAPDEKTFEARCPGFLSRCLRFVGWVAPPRRKTRFRLLASSTGRDSDPQGSDGRFPSCNPYISSPFPRLCLAQCPFFRAFFRAAACRIVRNGAAKSSSTICNGADDCETARTRTR